MRGFVWKITKDVCEAFAKGLSKPCDDQAQPPAIETQKIFVDDDAYDDAAGGVAAAHMVTSRFDGPPQRGHLADRSAVVCHCFPCGSGEAGYWTILRRDAIAKVQKDLVDIAPSPTFRRFVSL